jgi:hypothetical protein
VLNRIHDKLRTVESRTNKVCCTAKSSVPDLLYRKEAGTGFCPVSRDRGVPDQKSLLSMRVMGEVSTATCRHILSRKS